MDCNKVREILLTDYIDGELPEQERNVLDGHLKECAGCSAVLEKLKGSAAAFHRAPELKPDFSVWQGIQDRIEAERERSTGWFEKLADALGPVMRTVQPVLRVAVIAAVLVGVVVLAKWPITPAVDPAYAYIEEQATFLEELQAGDPELFNGDLNDYEAVLENSSK